MSLTWDICWQKWLTNIAPVLGHEWVIISTQCNRMLLQTAGNNHVNKIFSLEQLYAILSITVVVYRHVSQYSCDDINSEKHRDHHWWRQNVAVSCYVCVGMHEPHSQWLHICIWHFYEMFNSLNNVNRFDILPKNISFSCPQTHAFRFCVSVNKNRCCDKFDPNNFFYTYAISS